MEASPLENSKMSQIPSVGVLIPTYNSEKTIARAISSVLAQTLRPIEVIVVDDGSTDDTVGVVKSLCSDLKPGFLKLIELGSNCGVYHARNVGWDAATGEFLALLDSDDSWHPRKLQIQAEYMVKHNELALTAHRGICLSENDQPPTLPQNWNVAVMTPWKLMVTYQFWTPSVMLRTDLPFRFDPQKRYSADRLLWIQLLFNGYKAVRLELPLAYLYKAPYGEAGLSSHLWETEKSELDNFTQLRQMGFLNRPQEMTLKAWALLKYVRRVWVSRRQ